MENYYQLLDVSPQASAEQIQEALNKKLRIWNNRTNSPDLTRRQEAERVIKTLEEAEGILCDATRRKTYDGELAKSASRQSALPTYDASEVQDLTKEAWRLLSEGRIPDTIYVATKATERDGNDPEAWAALSLAKARWGEVQDAVYEMKRAIKLKPNNPQYYFDLGSILQENNHPNEALEQFEKASICAPGVPIYRAAVGSVLAQMDKYSEAIEALEQCVAAEPGNTTFNWQLAAALLDYDASLGRIVVSEQQARTGLKALYRARQLSHGDPKLKAAIERAIGLNEEALSKKWARGIGGTIKGAVGIGIAALIAAAIVESVVGGAMGTPVGSLAGLACVAAWVGTGIQPGWKINKAQLS